LVDVDVSASRQLNHEEAGESSRPKIALDLVGSKRESLTVLSIVFLKPSFTRCPEDQWLQIPS
jgi:hypothetical protein